MSKKKTETNKTLFWLYIIGVSTCILIADKLVPDVHFFSFVMNVFILAILFELTMLGVDKLVANE